VQIHDLERLLHAYELGLGELNEGLVATLGIDAEARDHLQLLGEVCAPWCAATPPSTSREPRPCRPALGHVRVQLGARRGHRPNITLRTMVNEGSVKPWQARYLGNALSERRTVFVAGPAGAGRSTLLNALLQLLSWTTGSWS